MEPASPLHERLAAVAQGRTFRAIGELTGTNAETVRRYMQGQSPSVEFLASLCTALKINGEWLLSGRGPMRADDVKAHALRSASGGELLTALVTAIERLTERVERLEVYMQTLESRMRGRENLAAAATAAIPARPPLERTDEQATPSAPESPDHGATGESGANSLHAGSSGRSPRARRIAEAIAQRPRQDAC